MRVAVGGLMHETNTFARGVTTLADFEAYQFAVGEQLFGFRGTKTELGGFLDGCQELGWEVVPSLYGVALPGGLANARLHDRGHGSPRRCADRVRHLPSRGHSLEATEGLSVTVTPAPLAA
jgi:microcystin degradation protein MlrC